MSNTGSGEATSKRVKVESEYGEEDKGTNQGEKEREMERIKEPEGQQKHGVKGQEDEPRNSGDQEGEKQGKLSEENEVVEGKNEGHLLQKEKDVKSQEYVFTGYTGHYYFEESYERGRYMEDGRYVYLEDTSKDRAA